MQNSPLEKTVLATIQYSCCTIQNSGKSVQHAERTGSSKRQTLQSKKTTREMGHERIIHLFAHFKTTYLYTYLFNTWLRAGIQEDQYIFCYDQLMFQQKRQNNFLKNKWLKESKSDCASFVPNLQWQEPGESGGRGRTERKKDRVQD